MLHNLSLVLATITTGLIAGLFWGFSISVMIALRGVDDRTFIEVMQRINAAIQNGPFAAAFLGAPLFTIVVIVLDLLGGRGLSVPVTAGFVLYAVSLAMTFGRNIPLNNQLDAAGRAGRVADPAAARKRFEAAWNRWNLLRALASIAAFGCLCWALLLTPAA